jgi:hypothetical protein
MKKEPKIYVMGELYRDSKGKYARSYMPYLTGTFVVGLGVFLAMNSGMKVEYQAVPVVKAEVLATSTPQAPHSDLPPVLQRIIKAESGGHQFGPSGQVLVRANTNGTVDMGIAQINTVWFKKAHELGLDLTKEEDNIKMAVWIYENKGTGPWESSRKNWQ